jgi:hypothetical protein
MRQNTKLRIRNRYVELFSLFTACLSEPGAGKSKAFEICVEALLRQLEEPTKSVVVHNFSRKGLFQHLVAHKGRAFMAHSEMSSFWKSNGRALESGNCFVTCMIEIRIGINQ